MCERPAEPHPTVRELDRWLCRLCIDVVPRDCQPKLYFRFGCTAGCDSILVQPIATNSLRTFRKVRSNRCCCAPNLHGQIAIVLSDFLDQWPHRWGQLEVALQITQELKGPLTKIRQHDRELAVQAQRAANGIALQIAEASKRADRDRVYRYRIAAGSTHELDTALRLATGWDYLEQVDLASVRALIDRVRAMLWRLQR